MTEYVKAKTPVEAMREAQFKLLDKVQIVGLNVELFGGGYFLITYDLAAVGVESEKQEEKVI